jgi:carbonic anhydrase
VHVDKQGNLAVIAVLFHQGEAEYPALAQLLAKDAISHAGDEVIEESTVLNVR